MKAAYIEKTGPADQIIYGDLPKPKATGSRALVHVKAVSVNPIDTYIRSGGVAMELPMPFVVGCDLAGVVETIGPEVTRLKVGDRVWGSNQGLFGRQGTFAQFAAVDEQWLYNLPEEVTYEDAAAIALVGITAHLGLFREANLKTSEKVFVHGGSGSVGSCVVQMARAVGASVLTTAGSDEKAQICLKMGANGVVNYKTGDLDDALKMFGPVDVSVREPARAGPRTGGDEPGHAGAARRHRRPRRKAGFSGGRLSYPRRGGCTALPCSTPRPTSSEKSAAEINRWLARGRLHPRIDRVMKLSQAAEAHKLQEQSTVGKKGSLAGKIVLVP